MCWGWVKAADGNSYALTGTSWSVERHWATGRWAACQNGGVARAYFDKVADAMAEAERREKGNDETV